MPHSATTPSDLDHPFFLTAPAAADKLAAYHAQLSPFTPCLTPSPSLPSTPSTASSPCLHPTPFFDPTIASYAASPAVHPLESLIFPIDPTAAFDPCGSLTHCDPLINIIPNPLLAARPASTDSGISHISRSSCASTNTRLSIRTTPEQPPTHAQWPAVQPSAAPTPAPAPAPTRAHTRRGAFRVSFAPPQLADDMHMRVVQDGAHDADDDADAEEYPPPHKRTRRSTASASGTTARKRSSTAGSRTGRHKPNTTPSQAHNKTAPASVPAPVKYRFVSVHTASHPASSSSQTPSPNTPQSAPPHSPSSDPTTTSTSNPIPTDAYDTPLLEEHLEDSEDEMPFEHGPTELPPRMYPGSGSGGGSGAGAGAGLEFGSGSRWSGRQGNGYTHSYGYHEKVIPTGRACSGAVGGKSGSRALRARSYPPAGSGSGSHAGGVGYSGYAGYAGTGTGGADGGGSVVYVRGRRKVVGKIPASELEFLPLLEARFTALEKALEKAVAMRGERALRNAMLPGSSFEGAGSAEDRVVKKEAEEGG